MSSSLRNTGQVSHFHSSLLFCNVTALKTVLLQEMLTKSVMITIIVISNNNLLTRQTLKPQCLYRLYRRRRKLNLTDCSFKITPSLFALLRYLKIDFEALSRLPATHSDPQGLFGRCGNGLKKNVDINISPPPGRSYSLS